MDPARTLVAAVMLLGAAWWDLRARRVPNTYWFPFVAFAAVFVAVDVAAGEWWHLIGAVVVAGLSYLFWRFGLWGGADAKGVMVLAFLVREHLGGVTSLAVLDALVAGMLLVLVWPPALLVLNLARGDVRFPAMLVGRRMDIEQARDSWVFPLETVDGWRWRPPIGQDLGPEYHALEKAGRHRVWVSEKMPLMAFIFAGFLLVSAFGSPISWLAAWLS